MEKIETRLFYTPNTADIMLVQESLQAAGMYSGEIDGQAGARTKTALRQYKKKHHLPVNNTIDASIVELLREAFY